MIDVLGWVTMLVAGTPPFMKDLKKMRIAMLCSGSIGGVYTVMLGSIPLTILNGLAVSTGVYHLFLSEVSKTVVAKLGLKSESGVDSRYEVGVG